MKARDKRKKAKRLRDLREQAAAVRQDAHTEMNTELAKAQEYLKRLDAAVLASAQPTVRRGTMGNER